MNNLLETFPEAKQIAAEKKLYWKNEFEKLRKAYLKLLYSCTGSERDIAFQESFLKIFLGKDVEKARKKAISWYYRLREMNGEKFRGKITDRMKSEAKEKDMAAVVETLTGNKFNRSGFIKCPFHPDDNPSMSVYKKHFIKCFQCGYSNDTIGFCMDQGMNFPEAVNFLIRNF
jgi:hypothetical protein